MTTPPSTESSASELVATLRLVESLVAEQQAERRRLRRFAFFRLVLVAMVVAWLAWALIPTDDTPSPVSEPHVGLIQLEGMILPGGDISADLALEALRTAMKATGLQALVLRINSPGGSATQAALIFGEIRRLKAKRPEVRVYAVIEDLGASGGYYIAAAADEILAHPSSLVGSIGVRLDGFGFTELMNKLGVERRLLTAGENKAPLDPFLPVDAKQKAQMTALLAEIHQQFIGDVKAGRGDRLKPNPEVFSGMIFSGQRAVALGLVDRLGTLPALLEDDLSAESVVDYTSRKSFPEALAERFGLSVGAGLFQALMSSNAQLVGARP